MKRSDISAISVVSLIAALVALPLRKLPAQAIVINDTAGEASAQDLGAEFTAVAELLIEGFEEFTGYTGGPCTGTLISPTTFLTAKHCTDPFSPDMMTVRFRGSDPENMTLLTREVINKFEIPYKVPPEMEILPGMGVPLPSLLDGTDIAILELNAEVETIDPIKFFAGNPTGIATTTVGFGLNGVGSEGHQFTKDGLRWASQNEIDSYGSAPCFGLEPPLDPPCLADTTIPNSTNIFSTDFDEGTAEGNTLVAFGSSPLPLPKEGTTASFDSGAPLLVNIYDEWAIIGVLSGGTTGNSVYGDISWFTGTNEHRSFIEGLGGEFIEKVPEPSSRLALIIAGMIGFGVARDRK